MDILTSLIIMYIKFNSTSVYMQWTSTIVTVSIQLYTHVWINLVSNHRVDDVNNTHYDVVWMYMRKCSV